MADHDPAWRLYAILDAETCARHRLPMLDVARAWQQVGVRLMQYRDKTADRATLLANARALRTALPPGEAFLILNDHPELVAECGFDGTHIGQADLPVETARAMLGEDRILGISTHSADQALAANSTDADYLAIGPVFSTSTKKDAEPVVGICGLQAARAITNKPLVAIGGITAERSREVLQAGADSIAVISALLPSGDFADITRTAQDFLARLQ